MTSRVGRFLARSESWHAQVARRLARSMGADLDRPWSELPADVRRALLRGRKGPLALRLRRGEEGRSRRIDRKVEWQGLLTVVEGWWREAGEEGWWRASLDSLMEAGECPDCHGGRLRPEALAVTVAGRSIRDVSRLTVDAAAAHFATLELPEGERAIARDVLREVGHRLSFLRDVGLGYLTLDRAASTLSGGEAQRIRLASQLGNRLVGVLYVLDEPSIGLHARDQRRLLDTLRGLRDLGNTILVVEHDRETIETADHVIDMGPGAGRLGGRVVAQGPPASLPAHPDSLTGAWLSGRRSVERRPGRRVTGEALELRGCTRHNLAGITARFPAGVLTVVTGVSGSGKSTLVADLLVPAVAARLGGGTRLPPGLASLRGHALVDKLLVIDQTPLGRSPTSNAATYSGLWDDVRALFAGTPEARMRGFAAGRFSVNVPGGRCEACQGRGVERIEMHFLSDVELTCEACSGRRFNAATLAVRWKGLTIADVLDLEVERALEVFGAHAGIRRKLRLLADTGLGYLKLGQSATTLSGGEAQRVKLAAELGRPGTGRSLVVLDEPTTGLHMDDVARLIEVLQRLVDQGNTVVVIEHNMDVIGSADWIVDLGPEGGEGGGRVVVAGTPADVAACAASHTGRCLRPAAAAVVEAGRA